MINALISGGCAPVDIFAVMIRSRLIRLSLILLLVLAGCVTGGRGVVHTVGRGETLWRISHTYGVDMQEVAEVNNIKDPTEIKAGKRIFIPGVRKVHKVTPFSPSDPPGDSPNELGAGKIVYEKDRFSWPIRGEIISEYGMRDGTHHDGLDIKAPEGTPIKAADSGKVVFVDSGMRGYGNIVILEHRDDFFTVYAHNKENLVKHGDDVTKGDVIAMVGSTGNASVCHLHFEVRQGKKIRNPVFFLP
ncbi:MAG: M23 family metallopeptidase [Deltaproteobacteria bacterium]|nr:M23 family metallopeptidase [Deltaproteobacteria bacterium]